MTIPEHKIYPRTGDRQTIYLKNVITNPNITVGDYTMYHDFVRDPTLFEQNNVLYHYPINHDRLVIGKFCSIACGARFLFNSANHTLRSLSTYPFPLFFEEWQLEQEPGHRFLGQQRRYRDWKRRLDRLRGRYSGRCHHR